MSDINKHDAQLIADLRELEESIRHEAIKSLCNGRSIAMLRMALRNSLDLIERLTRAEEEQR